MIKIKNKKAQKLIQSEFGEFVIAAVLVVFIAVFALGLMGFFQSKTDKAMASLIKSFSSAVKDADSGGVGRFSMIGVRQTGNEKGNYFLVYFGNSLIKYYNDIVFADKDGNLIRFGKAQFNALASGKNLICMCYLASGEEVSYCKQAHCRSLGKEINGLDVLPQNYAVDISIYENKYNMAIV
jgi:hypothetical protein